MLERHLLPPEIDLLVDGDVGFGVAPLRAHVAECGECRARVDELRAVADSLDELPRFTPRVGFADRIQGEIQIVEPWHVALTETVRRMIPESAPMRALAAVGAGVAGITISGRAVWLAFRVDLATWTYNVFLDVTREGLLAGAGTVVRAAFADLPGTEISAGTIGLGLGVLP
jgi:hypothetical protein